MDKYKTIKTLGEGAFGTVYKATNVQTGEVVAIKKFKAKYTSWEECMELREIKSLRKLNHKNVIKLKEVLRVNDELYMVFEYLDYNIYELYSKSKQNQKKLTENQIRNIVYQVVEGLAYMHRNGFFHRDMKPENLLIYNNIVKICDFGLAREIRSRPPFTEYVSTRWYRAPELLLRSKNYNSPVDIFALGCIMVELYNQSPLFPGLNEADQLNKIVKILGTPDQNNWPEGFKLASAKGYYFPQQKGQNLADLIPDASPEAVDLIQQMLQYQSRKRPTASEILKHPFFQNCKPVGQEVPKEPEVVFQSIDNGKPLDTKKQDMKQDILRKTNTKFGLTRQQLFKLENDVKRETKHDTKNKFGQHLNSNSNPPEQDLDSILKQLEEKANRKKLPMISTKDKFYSQPKEKPQLRESKTEMSKPSSYQVPLHQPFRVKPEKANNIFSINNRLFNHPTSLMKDKDDLYNFNTNIDPNRNAAGSRNQNMDLGNKFGYNNMQSLQPMNGLPALQPLPPAKFGSWPRSLGSNPTNVLNNLPKPRDVGPPLRARDLFPSNKL